MRGCGRHRVGFEGGQLLVDRGASWRRGRIVVSTIGCESKIELIFAGGNVDVNANVNVLSECSLSGKVESGL